MSRRRAPLLLLPLLFLLVAGFPAISGILTDWWWFQEIGYEVIFTRQIVMRSFLFAGAGLAAGLLVLANLRLATRGLAGQVWSVRMGPGKAPVDVAPLLRFLRIPVSIVIGLLVGLGVSSGWTTFLFAWHRVPFGVTDPIFQRDISYYVFALPALQGILAACTLLTALLLVLVLATYRLRNDVVSDGHGTRLAPGASRHVGFLLGALFLLFALSLWFVDVPSLVTARHDLLVGANYTDLHATLPALRVSAALALVLSILMVRAGMRGALGRTAIRGIAVYAVVAILGRGLFPAVMQKLFVAPTELTREAPYIDHHIAATRAAWQLDSIEKGELQDAGGLTMADIRNNAPTIENVRLWDRAPLLQTFGQLQEIRTYYDFLQVDDDRYWIDGKYRQVLLSPRELQIASLPPQARNFINEHLTFTHGMGLTLGPVNQVTSEGLPVLFIKDLPPVSNVSLKVTRPQIYYGEVDYDFAVVKTKEREFDHPSADGDVYTPYAGAGGIPTGSLFRRLVLATHFGASNLLLSSNITAESRILYYRNIVRRVTKALPFFDFDRDPYLVVTEEGTLKWMLDAYTGTSRYPYSQRLAGGANYLRNSVKVVIDAYDGTVTAYLSDPNDPVIRTWARAFPGVLHPLEEMPQDLRAHMRYPDQLFTAQTALYATYHLDSPAEFYSREDQWQIPVVDEGEVGAVPFMRHIVMRLPGEKDAEFVYMVPYTPRGRENLAAWLVARNDGAAYGKLRVYTISRQSLVFGPTQIENRISQDTRISEQVSLWDRSGTKVLKGDLLVIPIEQSLLYVQPLYLQAEGGRIPELKRVVLAYQNQVVMAETLEGALQEVFGGDNPRTLPLTGAASPGAPTGTGNAALIDEARQLYDRALQAQREGNWARYGDEIKALGEVLKRMGGGS